MLSEDIIIKDGTSGQPLVNKKNYFDKIDDSFFDYFKNQVGRNQDSRTY